MFNENGINLYDNNVLGSVTRTQWVKTASMNCYYDATNNTYVVDRFRLNNKNGKIYTNVNDGLMLASAIKSTRENVALFEGVRFNKDDVLKVEDYSGIHEKTFQFKNASQNTFTRANGTSISFNISKSNSLLSTNRYGWEIAVNSNNVIVDHGSHVNIPSGGYKFVVTSAGQSTSEQINMLFDECFTRGSTINISGTNIFVNSSSE